MAWVDGHIVVNHPRQGWGDCCPDTLVHRKLGEMYGSSRAERAEYLSAKTRFDQIAAAAVVERCMSEEVLDQFCDLIIPKGLNGRLVLPYPDFDDEMVGGGKARTNALPYAYAAYLSEMSGLPIDEEIVQSARVGRTKLNRLQRFLWQPHFGGNVRTDQPYILVDDVMTTGGTLAALRSYIERNGGTVLFATVLANRAGQNQPFAITQETLKLLGDTLGEGFEPFWRETIGHEASCLTEFEGRVLIDWCNDDEQAAHGAGARGALLQRLRTRLDAVASS